MANMDTYVTKGKSDVQDKLKKALEIASENIKSNNTVYTQSISCVKETIVCEEKRLIKK